jgi:hypothetical protein
MQIDGDQTQGFTCDVDGGRVTLSLHARARGAEPRAAFRWEALIVSHPSGRTISGDGDAAYVTFWRAANAYAAAADHDAFPSVDWDEVAAALNDVGVRFE